MGHSASSRAACLKTADGPLTEDSCSIIATLYKPFGKSLYLNRKLMETVCKMWNAASNTNVQWILWSWNYHKMSRITFQKRISSFSFEISNWNKFIIIHTLLTRQDRRMFVTFQCSHSHQHSHTVVWEQGIKFAQSRTFF